MKTLKACVDSSKDAPEDLRRLARDLESTLGYVEELKCILDKNEKALVLKDLVVQEAKARLAQAGDVVEALAKKLLRKSH